MSGNTRWLIVRVAHALKTLHTPLSFTDEYDDSFSKMGAVLHLWLASGKKPFVAEHARILAFLLAGLESTHQPRWNKLLSFGSYELCGADMWLSLVARYEEFSNHSLWQDLGARAISSAALTAALKGIRLAYHRQVQKRASLELSHPKFQASHLLFRTRLAIGVGEFRCLERGQAETSGKKQIKLFFFICFFFVRYYMYFFIFCSVIDVIFIFNTRICVFIV